MIYGSVCSGIEAASVAWHPLGWKPAFLSEIDAFPRAVLAHHYPDAPLHGDFTTIEEGQYAAIDVLVGGTPCQSFSVAGLRAGLDDERGNLALEFCKLARRLRPRWVIWENVPGVLSLDGGRAFASILGGLAECGYGLAYRVLDAQFVRVDGFGRAVPQRRRRVFVVGHLGDWRRAAAVLFERASLSGDPPPRRQAGQGAAPTLASRAGGGGRPCGGDGRHDALVAFGGNNQSGVIDVATACRAKGGSGRGDFETETFVAHALRAEGFDASEDGTGRGTPVIPVVCATLDAAGDRSGTTQDAIAGRLLPIACDETQITSAANRCNPQPGDACHPLASGARPPTLAFNIYPSSGQGAELEASPTEIANTVSAVQNGGMTERGARIVTHGVNYASPQEANAGALLRGVRDALGEEAFAQWGLGILDTLQPAEILRAALHGGELRPATFSRRWVVCCALGSPFTSAEGAMQSMREAAGEGRAPQGREPSEQLARELGAYLSGLSQPGAQAERFMRDLWVAAEGLGLLRQALSAVQETRRSISHQGQPVRSGKEREQQEPGDPLPRDGLREPLSRERVLRSTCSASEAGPARTAADRQGFVHAEGVADTAWRVRRLVVEECEFLQGFPRGYTAIPYRGKPAADGPRYKALGNSMAVNVMRWIGQRIEMAERL